MTAHAADPHPSPAAPPAPEARHIDLVVFGDHRLGMPQQVAQAATLFQQQFGRPPTVVCLSPAAVQPPYPVQVRAQIPAGYLWVAGAVATRAPRGATAPLPWAAAAPRGPRVGQRS